MALAFVVATCSPPGAALSLEQPMVASKAAVQMAFKRGSFMSILVWLRT
jgi:hypothetical protein